MTTMSGVKAKYPDFAAGEVVALPQFAEPGRGALGVAECGASVPFNVTRAFYLYDMPTDAVRGEHAHHETHQFLICLAGAMEATLWDRTGKRSITVDSPAMGLYVRPMIWLTLVNRSPGTICLVLTSTNFEEADYIRDAKEFAGLID